MEIGPLSSPALSPVDPLAVLNVAKILGIMAYHVNFMMYKGLHLDLYTIICQFETLGHI